MSHFIKRTNKYLVMAYNYLDEPQDNISADDDSFIELTADNITKITNMKQKNKFNFYNKFSLIGNKTIGSLVNKFSFNKADYDNISQVFNEIIPIATTDMRCYDCLLYMFTNDIGLYDQIKDFSKWVENAISGKICVSFYDLKYLGGTAGIVFGKNKEHDLPLIITERATEYIKSDKVIVKTGTLEKEMSGISSINFKLQPVNFVKNWLFTNNNCLFEPKSLYVSYRASSADYTDDNGFTTVNFDFVPIEADTFYKNKMMFETQNRFFDWAIDAATKPESTRDVMRSGLEIPMRLKSIEVNNNTARNKEYSADLFLDGIMNSLGFCKNNVTIVNKENSPDNSKVKLIFSNSPNYDPNSYTECLFKAYL